MKEYLLNKEPKDARFLTTLRKSINKDRMRNGFSVEDVAHELGMSLGTLEQKLKPSVENDFSISEWNHHLTMSADFSTLEYFANKHGFELKKLETYCKDKSMFDISCQADKAMIEFGEAFKEVKDSLQDKKVTQKEKIKSITEIDEAIKELQQLKQDFESKETEE